MRYLKQFGIILLISFVGEVIHQMLPFPIPASIYGLVIILIGLITGIIKVEAVKEVARFLIEIMPLMFIPAAVGLIHSWQVLRPVILPVGIMTIVSTVVVMVVSGHVTQFMMKDRRIKQKER